MLLVVSVQNYLLGGRCEYDILAVTGASTNLCPSARSGLRQL